MKKIIVYKQEGYIEYSIRKSLRIESVSFFLEDNNVSMLVSDGKKVTLEIQRIYELPDMKFMVVSEEETILENTGQPILLGQKHSDIEIENGKYVITHKNIVNDDEHDVYVNGVLHKDKAIAFNYGDQLMIEGMIYIPHKGQLKIIGKGDSFKTTLPLYLERKNLIESFPTYKRSPRIIKRLKSDKITISKPPTKENRKKNSLIKIILPPIVMGIGTVAMSLMMGRGMYMLIGLAATGVSLVFSVTAYFSDKKELKEKNKRRETIYEDYLLDIRKKLNAYKMNEIEALHYNNPNAKEIEQMIHEYSPRIYERDTNDDDFLTVCVGTANAKSEYTVNFDYDILQTEKDELLDEAKEVYNEYQMIEDKPIHIDLKKAHLGIVGESKEIHQQLKWILSQITFFHSYHDVQIIMLYSDVYKDSFDYIKWYPHVGIRAHNISGNIYNERVRDQVLGSLHQILKDRKNKRDEEKKEMSFLPHYVIIVDDYHMIMNHSIMEYLQEDTAELGFSLIYTAQKRANLSQNIKTVLVMEDMETATLLMKEGIERNQPLKEEQLATIDVEKSARNLSVLQHMQGVSSHIPESVTFFDMYKVTSPEGLNIPGRWAKSESHKSLAVPLGLRAEDDIVELNLHEKAHGPHGLVAGTTGSGKSETIQSYILSLAVNFSPYEVGFLLIDYKGGGMANLFKKLPHLLGTITNLDGTESMRALASIKAELARRQRVFNEYEVNNINNYNKLFKSGKAKEPLPHLFLISDEFAELKKEQPEFMSELVSVARIGRTLGVHLILATQKPTGVVDDQIWSNSKFKLALKVQDESDSREIIKTSDAAFLTQAGRAYLQVGNNEIYELFQSAWSGAQLAPKADEDKVDKRIYKINLLGQGELINKDLSDEETTSESMKTQLDGTVEYIADFYEQEAHKEVIKPWLPSLKAYIASPYINDVKDVSQYETIDLNCPLGFMDIPEEQQQQDYCVNFIKDGNLAVFASSGFGKSTTLGTLMLTLAIKNNPEYLNFYVLDFGNSSLIPYKMLPHVADYMTFDSEEKIQKFQKILMAEMKERKQLFGREMVQNYDMYNQLHPEKPLKAIFMMIDNFDVVKEISMDFEDFIMKTTRDGAGLGIYTIISATRSNSIRFAILNNFKNKVVQYMNDDSDAMSLLGRSKYKLQEEVKGRALIKHRFISMMQVYAPVEAQNDVEFITKLKVCIKSITTSYTGHQVLGIPVLPEIFTTKDFVNYKCETINSHLLGLSLDNVESVHVDTTNSPYVIIGPPKSGKTNFLEILMNQDEGKTYIFDSAHMDLYKYKDTMHHYLSNDEEVQGFVEDLFEEVEKRKTGLEEALDNDDYDSPKAYYASLPTWTVYIDDADEFILKVQNIPNITNLLTQATGSGIQLVATLLPSKMKGYDDLTKLFKNAISGALLGQPGSLSIFSVNMRDVPSFGYANLYDNGDMRKVKLPKYMGF